MHAVSILGVRQRPERRIAGIGPLERAGFDDVDRSPAPARLDRPIRAARRRGFVRLYTHSMRRFAGLLVLLAGGLACSSPPPRPPPATGWARVGPDAPPALEREDGRVLVHFPHGACATAWLEIQVLAGGPDQEPGLRQWVAHPDGDRLRSGTCRLEDPARLLNETRVRCYDPAAQRAPSAWVVGVDIDGSDPPDVCPEAWPE